MLRPGPPESQGASEGLHPYERKDDDEEQHEASHVQHQRQGAQQGLQLDLWSRGGSYRDSSQSVVMALMLQQRLRVWHAMCCARSMRLRSCSQAVAGCKLAEGSGQLGGECCTLLMCVVLMNEARHAVQVTVVGGCLCSLCLQLVCLDLVGLMQ